MKIAIVTGASSGIGREFVKQIAANYKFLDEIWVIARNKKKLKELQHEVSKKLVILPYDIKKQKTHDILREKLRKENPRIKLLVNSAGVGYIGNFAELPYQASKSAIRLNCEALTALTYLCLPYLYPGSRLIQIASAAAFVPQPGFAVYAASKAFVLSFSRALRAEVRDFGITVTCVCPGPVDTAFYDAAEEIHAMADYKKSYIADPEDVVKKAIRDAAIGRELSIYGKSMKGLYGMCKVVPHKLLVWMTEYLNHYEY